MVHGWRSEVNWWESVLTLLPGGDRAQTSIIGSEHLYLLGPMPASPASKLQPGSQGALASASPTSYKPSSLWPWVPGWESLHHISSRRRNVVGEASRETAVQASLFSHSLVLPEEERASSLGTADKSVR